ncbi:hypothetical protein HDU97_007278 [Phlyctochytrium planicorne]|nr:hypothetical protein HDU97_007278 [Phlyctochytrium planicorne]
MLTDLSGLDPLHRTNSKVTTSNHTADLLGLFGDSGATLSTSSKQHPPPVSTSNQLAPRTSSLPTPPSTSPRNEFKKAHMAVTPHPTPRTPLISTDPFNLADLDPLKPVATAAERAAVKPPTRKRSTFGLFDRLASGVAGAAKTSETDLDPEREAVISLA